MPTAEGRVVPAWGWWRRRRRGTVGTGFVRAAGARWPPGDPSAGCSENSANVPEPRPSRCGTVRNRPAPTPLPVAGPAEPPRPDCGCRRRRPLLFFRPFERGARRGLRLRRAVLSGRPLPGCGSIPRRLGRRPRAVRPIPRHRPASATERPFLPELPPGDQPESGRPRHQPSAELPATLRP